MLYDQGQEVYFDWINNEIGQDNRQTMTYNLWVTDTEWQNYTPLFIDLVDDSNQKEYFRIKNPTSGEIYPNDDIVITNYKLLKTIAFSSSNVPLLKYNLIKHAEELGTTEQEITNYIRFYEYRP